MLSKPPKPLRPRTQPDPLEGPLVAPLEHRNETEEEMRKRVQRELAKQLYGPGSVGVLTDLTGTDRNP